MRLTSLLMDLPKILPKHLPRFPAPKMQLFGGRSDHHGFYVANHDRKVDRRWKLNTHVSHSSFFFLFFCQLDCSIMPSPLFI